MGFNEKLWADTRRNAEDIERIAKQDLTILCIGDSHTNGKMPTVLRGGTEYYGLSTLISPRDKMWNGSLDASYFKANNTMLVSADTVGSSDPNLGLSTLEGSMSALFPLLLRFGYPTILGKIRIANGAIGGSSAFTWSGEQAYCNLVVVDDASRPQDNDTVTIDGIVYRFKTTPTQNYDVTIESTRNATMQNLVDCINGEANDYFPGTPKHPTCFCPSAAGSSTKVQYILTGTVGNSIVVTSSTARITIKDGALVDTATLKSGANSSVLYGNVKTKTTGIGKVDIITITLGTNDANRKGLRAVSYLTEMTKLVDKLHIDYPDAKIILSKPPILSGATAQTAITSIVNPAIDALCLTYPFVFNVDAWALGNDSGDVKILGTDGLHLSYYGYSLWSQLFCNKIGSVLLDA